MITVRRTTTTWLITFNDHDYRVTHQVWPSSSWGDGGDTWSVTTSHTDRVCDPSGLTHKRVVEAVKASLLTNTTEGAK
jgi:hypothetical protein